MGSTRYIMSMGELTRKDNSLCFRKDGRNVYIPIENTREIERLASNMKIRVIKADASIYNETLDNIVNGKISSVNSTSSASISPLVADNQLPSNSILIFCDLSEKHLNRMLFELKSRKVQIDLKAILTPTNRKWTLRQLHDELKRERASFT